MAPSALEADILARSETDATQRTPTLTAASVLEIASRHDLPGHAVEAAATFLGIAPARYLRNQTSLTLTDQGALLRASVALVGLGGLGGQVLENLARAGIGTIHGADGDRFEESNLNRQILADSTTIGTAKAMAAARRVERINPSVSFSAIPDFLDEPAMTALFSTVNLAVDGLGGLDERMALQRAATEADVPLVTGALAGWTGYVSVVMPGRTGPAQFMGTDNGAEELLGCPAPTVAAVAAIMSAQAVQILSGKTASLNGNILLMDLSAMSFDIVEL